MSLMAGKQWRHFCDQKGQNKIFSEKKVFSGPKGQKCTNIYKFSKSQNFGPLKVKEPKWAISYKLLTH